MVGCFRFEDLKLIEPLRNFLEESLNCKVFKSYYLDYQVLYVHEDFYQDSIIKGCDFLTENNAKKVCWLDTYQIPRQLDEIPLLYAEINVNKNLEEVAEDTRITIEKIISKEVLFKKYLGNNIFLHLLRKDCSLEEHIELRKKLQNYVSSNKLNNNITRITFCSFFGKKIV